ncbi:MAG: CinA family protein [Pseudonocardia sp.]
MHLPARLLDPAHAAAAVLVERGETLAVAESSAGGLISAALLSFPGASRFYRGGFVVYTLDGARAQLARATTPAPQPLRGACEPFVRYLAAAAAELLGADRAVAETGATGPSANPYGDPPGHAWVAVIPGPAEHVLTGNGDRDANMVEFAARALELLRRTLAG